MRIKDIPETERPREKLYHSGAGALSNTELIAVLIGSGSQEASALTLAERILSRDESGLLFLEDCCFEELCDVDGIGAAKASVILAAAELGRRIMTAPREKKIDVSSPDRVASIFMESMRYLHKEHFRILMLNIKNEIIAAEDVSIGTVSSSEAHPRDVFATPIRRGAANIILVHNHPSGNPEPSRADLLLTERLVSAGELLGISVLDHIIIGDGKYVSLKSEGRM